MTVAAQRAVAALNDPDNLARWQADPLAYLESFGSDFSTVDPTYLAQYRTVISGLDVGGLGDLDTTNDASEAIFQRSPVGCAACQITIGATVTAMAAVAVAALIASDGAAAPAEPAIEAAGGAAVAAETGLAPAQVAAIFAKAFAAAGAAGIVAEVLPLLCQAAGAC